MFDFEIKSKEKNQYKIALKKTITKYEINVHVKDFLSYKNNIFPFYISFIFFVSLLINK